MTTLDRATQAKEASRTLHKSEAGLGVRMVRLSSPKTLATPHGHLIQIGAPITINGPHAYPKIVRGLLWELRTAEFIDSDDAVMWALYDKMEDSTYVGIGVVKNDPLFVARARALKMIVLEL